MAFSVQDISAEIAAAGILRNNKFEVTFTPPPGLIQSGAGGPPINFGSLQGIEKVVHLYCETANIPGVALDVAPIRRFGYGPMEKKPFAPTFIDASFEFRSDAYGNLWKYLQSWMRLVLNYQNINGVADPTGILLNQHAYELAYKQDYVTDITVDTYDECHTTPVVRTVLRQAYPIFVGDIQLAWKAKNDYVKIPVTFTFIDWYHADAQPIQAGAFTGT